MKNNVTKFFLDTEFDENGKTVVLISIGIVCENNKKFYEVSNEFNPNKCNKWVRENVLPYLFIGKFAKQEPVSRFEIKERLLAFVNKNTKRGAKPEFWADHASYDWIVLCQLFGRMIDLPENFPKHCMDTKQEEVMIGNPEMPKKSGTEHNALDDAIYTMKSHKYLTLHGDKLLTGGYVYELERILS